MDTPPPSPLAFPTLFDSADRAAAQYQRRFLCLKVVELSALVGGAVLGVLHVRALWGTAGVLAVLCFLVAVGIRLSGAGREAEKRWYDARAAAESIKSLSWQYATCGEAFRQSDPDPERAFLDRLHQILAAIPHLDVPAACATNAGVTPSMRALRGSDQAERCHRYREERIENQVSWYAREATRNKRLSFGWTVTVIAVEVTAVAVGIFRVTGALSVDLLGVFGAISAGLIAWMQAKNYTELSESYTVTSHEAGLVAHSIRATIPENDWAQSIHDAEAAFSREHTLWLARRQSYTTR